jgi:hypothetical protein
MVVGARSFVYLSAVYNAAAHCRAVAWEESMRDLRSPRRLIRMWHRRQKATIDHLVHSLGDADGTARASHPAFTASGQAVEDQIRKAWRPSATGLAIF